MGLVLSYVLPLLVAFFALIPPILFRVSNPPHEYWPLVVTLSAFLGIRLLFTRTSILVRVLPVITLIICFFSCAPYASFSAYVSIIACCWFYYGVTKMTRWEPMFTVLKCLLILNVFMLVMQYFGQDNMLNWSLEEITTFGVVGQHMQMGAFSLVLTAMLSLLSPWFLIFPIGVALFCNSSWTLACVGVWIFSWSLFKKKWWLVILGMLVIVGFVYMGTVTHKFSAGLSPSAGRLHVWKRSVELLNARPWTGWGPSTFQYVFHPLSEMKTKKWTTAHNDFVQMAFELGYPFLTYMIMVWLFVLWKLGRHRQAAVLAAFLAITMSAMVHFPMRMAECVPILITFGAYMSKQGYFE